MSTINRRLGAPRGPAGAPPRPKLAPAEERNNIDETDPLARQRAKKQAKADQERRDEHPRPKTAKAVPAAQVANGHQYPSDDEVRKQVGGGRKILKEAAKAGMGTAGAETAESYAQLPLRRVEFIKPQIIGGIRLPAVDGTHKITMTLDIKGGGVWFRSKRMMTPRECQEQGLGQGEAEVICTNFIPMGGIAGTKSADEVVPAGTWSAEQA